ncbi:hypothetical protein A5789_08535 [Nocardia sp. 852002-51101_SCH5132738]|nr:hypothetical protein A5789_08535 [Nocardia sp. 852002-51101_SCH5132738]OBB32796.1 hypothetical protein A5748_07730 [Nocardia sp. 852002-51244_SCH5132740]OBF81071.1 hypothetical protein A9X06_20245 [Mycobacterium sp. 852002-51759_SCH5129042]
MCCHTARFAEYVTDDPVEDLGGIGRIGAGIACAAAGPWEAARSAAASSSESRVCVGFDSLGLSCGARCTMH